MLLLGCIAVVIALLVIVCITLQTLKDLKTIGKMSENRKIVYLCTAYENIFECFVLPKSFLLMKNRGENLCKFEGKIEYIDYGINHLFM